MYADNLCYSFPSLAFTETIWRLHFGLLQVGRSRSLPSEAPCSVLLEPHGSNRQSGDQKLRKPYRTRSCSPYINRHPFVFLFLGRMSSPLENIPCDVLQYISILASSSSPFDPPVEILCLMQTGPVIYEALNICSAPHIYAGIFSSKFDTAAPIRRHHITITDSALASELVNRCRLLQRSKRGDISSRNLINDLTTALWMYLESDGLNERQLLNVGFPDFILSVARTHLKGASSSHEIHHDIQPTLLGKLIIWLLCLALSRRK